MVSCHVYIYLKKSMYFYVYIFAGTQQGKKDSTLLQRRITEELWELCLFMTLLMKKHLRIL